MEHFEARLHSAHRTCSVETSIHVSCKEPYPHAESLKVIPSLKSQSRNSSTHFPQQRPRRQRLRFQPQAKPGKEGSRHGERDRGTGWNDLTRVLLLKVHADIQSQNSAVRMDGWMNVWVGGLIEQMSE